RGDRAAAEARLHRVAAAALLDEPQRAGAAWMALVELELATLEGPTAPTDRRERTAALDRAAQLLDYADASLLELDSRAELASLAARLALLDHRASRASLIDPAIEQLAEQQLRAPDLLLTLLEL